MTLLRKRLARFVAWALTLSLVVGAAGCSGEKDKGKFKDRDRPKPAAEAK
jgi:hypothetical protein